ncbi:hypothetical protein ACVNF4_04475 [Streptomyces sp. S6]
MPAWSPRPPRSPLRVWTRYLAQWLWAPPFWLLVRLPLIVLALLEIDVPGPGSPVSHRRNRFWLTRAALRRSLLTDPQSQEGELRRLLAEHRPPCAAARGLPCTTRHHHLTIDDTYYRLLGARHAYRIAHTEYGWRLSPEVERGLPGRLVLRCS